MKIATGTVVRGKIIVEESEFADGTAVYIVSRDEREPMSMSTEELAELEAGIAEADRGELLPGDEVLEDLRRFG